MRGPIRRSVGVHCKKAMGFQVVVAGRNSRARDDRRDLHLLFHIRRRESGKYCDGNQLLGRDASGGRRRIHPRPAALLNSVSSGPRIATPFDAPEHNGGPHGSRPASGCPACRQSRAPR